MITLAHQEHPEISPVQLCDLLGVSRSWYDESRNQADPDPQDIALRDEIERIILGFCGYGYRRVTRELARRGWEVNHKTRAAHHAERITALSSPQPIRAMAFWCIPTCWLA